MTTPVTWCGSRGVWRDPRGGVRQPADKRPRRKSGPPCFPLQDVVQEALQVLPGRRRDLLRRQRRVDPDDALWLPLRQLQEARAYPLVKLERLAADAVGEGFVVLAGQAVLRRDVQQDREVRRQAAGGDVVDGAQVVQVEAAPVALVGQGGVSIAVTEDDIAALQRRADHLLHVLGGRRLGGLAGALSALQRDQRAAAEPG